MNRRRKAPFPEDVICWALIGSVIYYVAANAVTSAIVHGAGVP